VRRYEGSRAHPAGPQPVYVYDGDIRRGRLTHHAKHSPDGFSWGYAGSGPADLARSLLIDALGDAARCATCEGTRKVEVPAESAFAAPATCWACTDGWGPLVEQTYQTFKFAVVSEWGDSWAITRDEILLWLRRQGLVDADPPPSWLYGYRA
jgi:uncharacterized protein DUF6166